jgi:hypothetical protein
MHNTAKIEVQDADLTSKTTYCMHVTSQSLLLVNAPNASHPECAKTDGVSDRVRPVEMRALGEGLAVQMFRDPE